jgi:predicted nucleic acid-binding protein
MYCLDSTFLIDYLDGDQKALALLEKLKDEQIFTTPINTFEVLTGAYALNPKEVARATALIDSFPLLSLTQESLHIAARTMAALIKEGKRIDASDVLIAGMALSQGCTKIITRNASHFERIAGVGVITY